VRKNCRSPTRRYVNQLHHTKYSSSSSSSIINDYHILAGLKHVLWQKEKFADDVLSKIQKKILFHSQFAVAGHLNACLDNFPFV